MKETGTSLKHEPVPLAIIGGGAAGMFAAAVAAERKVGCLVFERKARLGAKMLMTANGRCNFTKDISPDAFLRDVGEPVATWVAQALRSCPPQSIIRGFKSLGVRLRRMEDGRMFPDSGQAATIVHAFGDLLRDEGVPLCVNCPVTGIQPMKNGFIVATSTFTVWARNVLVATGGLSFPKTGSVGDGQDFARRLGHRIEPCRAGLTGVEVRDPAVASKAGARFDDGAARVLDAAGRTLFSSRGEVDCEPWGLSGAAVYNCQRWIARHGGDRVSMEVSFGGRSMRLRELKPRPLKEAIVTIGGVSLDDVDPATMMSRKVPGLFFAGEVLDIDGPTGGYNLTLAFATARAAVIAALAAMPAGGIALPTRPAGGIALPTRPAGGIALPTRPAGGIALPTRPASATRATANRPASSATAPAKESPVASATAPASATRATANRPVASAMAPAKESPVASATAPAAVAKKGSK